MAQDVLQQVRALGPQIDASAAADETATEIAREIIDALIAAGVFGMMAPRELGGGECHPAAIIDVVRELSYWDGSTGWYVGATTLDFERSSIGSAVGVRQAVEENLKWMRANKAGMAPTDYESAKTMWTERWVEAGVAQLLSYRIISMQAAGKIPNSEASISKLFSTELSQRVARTAMKMLGMRGPLRESWVPFEGRVGDRYLESVPATIAGGTSEIQRNIIATRGLGLPRG